MNLHIRHFGADEIPEPVSKKNPLTAPHEVMSLPKVRVVSGIQATEWTISRKNTCNSALWLSVEEVSVGALTRGSKSAGFRVSVVCGWNWKGKWSVMFQDAFHLRSCCSHAMNRIRTSHNDVVARRIIFKKIIVQRKINCLADKDPDLLSSSRSTVSGR